MVFYKGNGDDAVASDTRLGACTAPIQNSEVRTKKYKVATTLPLLITVTMLTVTQFQDAKHIELCVIYMLL